ncbi:hypothetical protein L2E82_22931 [Cichorium intybus]|uniref:Uncharacterized protein n=1 Tax=Cichorium intybus TaxID=13427 RepID=A0ACB9DZK2_CICIN|nr:hypothetical protein L2E82_22931 [Cichorium intybus]
MAKAGNLLMVVGLLLVFMLTCTARPAKDTYPATAPQLKDVEGEVKDEWLMRKTFDEAHLDYIYTQEQPDSNRHHR